jgi:hypothetical protein
LEAGWQYSGKNRRFFNMKMTMFALVLAIGMAFSAFAADEPPKIELEGVIQQLPIGRLFGIWMVSQRADVTEATVIEEEDGPIRVGAKVVSSKVWAVWHQSRQQGRSLPPAP